MSFDVPLGFYRKMYVVRSDDNNMAMSTVSSYGETDYNRSFVLTAFPFQMPKNCCVPHCTKKVYVEEGKKISFHRFPKEKNLLDLWIRAIRRDIGSYFQINKNTSVCSRHFKPEDFKETLSGRRILWNGAVPSKFDWKSVSPKKRKAPTQQRCDNQPESGSDEDTAGPSHVNQDLDVQAEDIQETDEAYSLEVQIGDLRTQVENLTERCAVSERKVFSFSRFASDDNSIKFYTGFPNVQVFNALYDFCNPGEQGENISYWHSSSTSEVSSSHGLSTKQGRPRILQPKEELFLTLCRLRQGFPEEHLAHLYGISQSTISRIIITWVNFLYLKFKDIPMWPSRELVDQYMPDQFKDKFPTTRVIIDSTEIRCQMPSSLLLNSELFSSYKNHATLKCLVGITPGGVFSFVSQLYTGQISDSEIVMRSGFLDQQFNNGDSVMANKGFTIDDLLPPGVGLNIPPFLGSQVQMSAQDVIRTQSIASLRVHVERAINKIKNFRIWDGVVPLNLFGIVNQMWTVCAVLCNLQKPIISI